MFIDSVYWTEIMKKTLSVIHEEGLLLIGVSFLVGHSGASFISSIIDKIIMPFVALFFGEEVWEHAFVSLGTVEVHWGEPLSTGLHFLMVLYIASLALRFLKKKPDD